MQCLLKAAVKNAPDESLRSECCRMTWEVYSLISKKPPITLAICECRKKMKEVLKFIFASDFCACCHYLISLSMPCVTYFTVLARYAS